MIFHLGISEANYAIGSRKIRDGKVEDRANTGDGRALSRVAWRRVRFTHGVTGL